MTRNEQKWGCDPTRLVTLSGTGPLTLFDGGSWRAIKYNIDLTGAPKPVLGVIINSQPNKMMSRK